MHCLLLVLLLVCSTSALNLALNRPTGQDTTTYNGQSSRAVDGNRDGVYNGNSCTHTDNQAPNWWWVDLGNQRPSVGMVTIYNRIDCCADRIIGAEVYVTDDVSWDTLQNTDTCSAHLCGTISSASHTSHVDCDSHHGRYLVVFQPNGNYLTLCEVEVGAGNIAIGLPSGMDSVGWGGVASRGNDGNTDGDYNHGSCTHTDNIAPGWWTLDLQEITPISHVKVYNRQDCCQGRIIGAKVFIVDSLDDGFLRSLVSNSVNLCGTITSASDVHTITCSGKTGRYVVVFLGISEYLTLCEVEVFPL